MPIMEDVKCADGINIVEINTILLKKVEKLSLYLIQLIEQYKVLLQKKGLKMLTT